MLYIQSLCCRCAHCCTSSHCAAGDSHTQGASDWEEHVRVGSMAGVPIVVHAVMLQVTATPREPVIRRSMSGLGAWQGAVATTAWWECLTLTARKCRAWASASALSDSSLSWKRKPGSVHLCPFTLPPPPPPPPHSYLLVTSLKYQVVQHTHAIKKKKDISGQNDSNRIC